MLSHTFVCGLRPMLAANTRALSSKLTPVAFGTTLHLQRVAPSLLTTSQQQRSYARQSFFSGLFGRSKSIEERISTQGLFNVYKSDEATEAPPENPKETGGPTVIPTGTAVRAAPISWRNKTGLAEFFDHDHGWDWGGDKAQFGRAWKCAELRLKSFDDLHKLWWVCLKERNRLFSQQGEAKRFQFMFPKKAHLNEIRKTMRRIKLVVWERKIAYFQAKEIYEKEVLRTQLWEQGIKDPVVIDATVLEKFPPLTSTLLTPKQKQDLRREMKGWKTPSKFASTLEARGRRRAGRKQAKKNTRWFVV